MAKIQIILALVECICQIIIQMATAVLDKNWDTLIEVSILTDDQERDAGEVIELMLKRWW